MRPLTLIPFMIHAFILPLGGMGTGIGMGISTNGSTRDGVLRAS